MKTFFSEVVLSVGAMFYLSSAGARFALNCSFCHFVVLAMSLLRLSYVQGLSSSLNIDQFPIEGL